MSAQGHVVVDGRDGDEGLVSDAIGSLVRMSNSWAEMARVSTESWGQFLPTRESCSLMWWLPPDGGRVVEVGSGLVEILFVRQVAFGPTSGHLVPVHVLMHARTGSACVTKVDERLVGFEPGFMASLPLSLRIMLDWLLYGFNSRVNPSPHWQVDQQDIVDEGNGYVVDSGRFLRYVTFNRFDCVCEELGGHFGITPFGEGSTGSVEVGSERDVPVGMVMVDNPEPVRIGNSASVGSGPASLHRAALAGTFMNPGDDSSNSSSDGSDSEVEVISINS